MDFAVEFISSRFTRPHMLPWLTWPFNGLPHWVHGLGGWLALGVGSASRAFESQCQTCLSYISHGEGSEASPLPRLASPFDEVSSKSVLHSFHWFAYRVPVAIGRVDASHPHKPRFDSDGSHFSMSSSYVVTNCSNILQTYHSLRGQHR